MAAKMIERREKSGADPWFMSEPVWQACMRMCLREDGRSSQGYGALLVDQEGRLVSAARNIIVKTGEPWLRMGYATHAEGMAISLGELFGKKVEGGRIYVAGILESGAPFIHDSEKPRFTCIRCANLMVSYGLAGINIPTEKGWTFLTSQEAWESAAEFKAESANNASGRENETVFGSYDMREELLESVLGHSPMTNVTKLRESGLRVTREASALLGLTTHGYVPATDFKKMVYSLIG